MVNLVKSLLMVEGLVLKFTHNSPAKLALKRYASSSQLLECYNLWN